MTDGETPEEWRGIAEEGLIDATMELQMHPNANPQVSYLDDVITPECHGAVVDAVANTFAAIRTSDLSDGNIDSRMTYTDTTRHFAEMSAQTALLTLPECRDVQNQILGR